MLPSITIKAPAKLNLALSVGPRNDTGLHPICSWMTAVSFYDELLVTQLEPDRLSRYAILWHADAPRRSEINWSIRSDLAVRAHLALEKHVGQRLPVQLKLEKRIPVGGGVGGGSADAAAMLHALNQLFELNLTDDQLAEVARTLGSDVPFLVRGGSAIVEGTGESITPISITPPLHAVLVFPDCRCPTADAYREFDTLTSIGLSADKVHQLATEPINHETALFNDLTPAATNIASALESHISEVAELAERPAHLSGSGSTLFIISDNEIHAEALAESITKKLTLPAIPVMSL